MNHLPLRSTRQIPSTRRPRPASGRGRRPWTVRVEAMESRLLLSAFDDTFGLLGKARLDIDGLGDQGMWVQAQADGKLLVSGFATFRMTAIAPPSGGAHTIVGAELRRFVARLNPDGTLDSAFGADGVVRLSSLPGLGTAASTITVQGDGKVLIAGSAAADESQDHATPPPPTAFAVARYNVDGTVDSGFGQQGIARVRVLTEPPSSYEAVSALSVQPDGKIVAAGLVTRSYQVNGTTESDGDMGVVRLNPDGTLDEAFGRHTEDSSTADNRRYDSATAVRVQPDGKVLIGGQFGAAQDTGGFGLVRYNPDGTRDGGFGQDGRVIAVFPKPAGDSGPLRGQVDDLLTQPDGRIVATGRVAENHYGLARYNADGTLDTSFGGTLMTRGVQSGIYRLAYRPDSGAIEVTGLGNGSVPGTSPPRPTGLQAYAARFAADGTLVSAARAEGLPFSGDEGIMAAAVQPDGRIVGVGTAHPTANAGENPLLYAQSADALVVRIDPAKLTPDAPPVVAYRLFNSAVPTEDDRYDTFGTIAEVVRVSGKPVIRGGRSYPFRITYNASEAAIRQTPVMATGPNFRADAQLVKLKAPKARAAAADAGTTTARPAVATYRLSAPGGTFKYSDNGSYGILVGAPGSSSATAGTWRVAGGFTIAAPAPRAARQRTAAATTATRLVDVAVAASAGGKREERAHAHAHVPLWSL